MKSTYLISNRYGRYLYKKVKNLPIIDFHCHLSPKEIYEDAPFDDIGRIWLEHDHYKWRLMRAFGIDEKYVTGDAPWRDKFLRYAEAVSYAVGSPLYHWSQMELSMYFGIEEPLNAKNAPKIWEKANEVIQSRRLSPRKLIEMSNVKYIATTDDIADDLSFHQRLWEEKSFPVTIAPSFRTDNALLIRDKNYGEYIKKLSKASGVEICGLNSFMDAIINRLNFFSFMECSFSDVGIEYFPDRISSVSEAKHTFDSALSGKPISDEEYSGFLGFMYLFLAEEYIKRGFVMQWHLGVMRNANTKMFENLGRDCGGDCIGDLIPNRHITAMLDRVNSSCGMPKTILYALNPAMSPSLASIAGSFPNTTCGAAWWFCDHKSGIINQLKTVCEMGHIGTFPGMVTDSRSFLSYARHDYFRRILCDVIGEFVENGEFPKGLEAAKLVENICYENSKALIRGNIK